MSPEKLKYNWAGDNPASPRHPLAVRLSDGSKFGTVEVSGNGSFGDLVTAPLHPEVQVDFVYGSHPDLMREITKGTGTVTEADSMVHANSGASIGGGVYIHTIRACHYRGGQGSLYRWTAIFDTPTLGVGQRVGMFSGEAATASGGSENAITVGYDHNVNKFGWCRLHSGIRDVHTLEVTVAATGAETLTVTLDGVATAVALTAGSLALNAQEIADNAFPGWDVENDGASVHFIANAAEEREGVYSVSSTGDADGTYTQDAAGQDAQEDWAYQEDWNRDKFDGAGPSGKTLVPGNGNVYALKFQYLGFGAIDCMIEDSETGALEVVHRYEYANTSKTPNVLDPTMHMGLSVENVTAAVDTKVSMCSAAAFVEGVNRVLGPIHGAQVDGAAAAEIPVLSVRNNFAFLNGVSRVNLRDLVPMLVAVGASGSNKPINISIVLNGVLTAPLFVDYGAGHSFAAVDSAATAISGGNIIFATSFSSGGSAQEKLFDLDIELHPGDVISVVVSPTGTAADYVASLSWKEDA